MQEITINTKYTKTYKTKANLDKALEKMNLPNLRYLVAYTEDGRVTAVFLNPGMYTTQLIHSGFKVLS
jgi:hypothetical protein